MTAKKWKSVIKKQTNQAGTYRKSFDSVIDTLSIILETRDLTYQQFLDEGSQIMVSKSYRGMETMAQNPLLTLWDSLNKTALTYWRDLGLTPKGLKAIDEQAMKEQKVSKLG